MEMVLAAMRDKAKQGVRGQDSETGASQQQVSLVIVSPRMKSLVGACGMLLNMGKTGEEAWGEAGGEAAAALS